MRVPETSTAPARTLDELTIGQARRVALRAQGLDRSRPPTTVTMRQLQQVVDRLAVLQIDSVNVLARAHLVPAYSRLGGYDVALLDRASGRSPRRLVEAWAHEASLVSPATYRLLGWRRRAMRERSRPRLSGIVADHPRIIDDVLGHVRACGPITAREVQVEFEHLYPRLAGGTWWTRSATKRVLEHLFLAGDVAVAGRTAAFERCYDVPERVLPASVLAAGEPDQVDAVRALVERGARAHGIGTAACFGDYFRIRPGPTQRAVRELVEAGVLRPVRVRGWDARPVYLHRDATVPRRGTGQALLSPFDPLVWERRRLEELFGTRYRIEIYTPAHRRVHGYYVLPFLLGERIAARVDLKADRRSGVLQVLAAHREAGAPAGTDGALAAELRAMADWLGLAAVRPAEGVHGDLAAGLLAELARLGDGGGPTPG